ncbi:efflux RND transporter periplasmic adaptor subunit [Kangiella sp. HZ709]|nr:efflux RND transporter periplasmic adaptor subunit [Kangiella sp. HZ709]
MTMKKTLLIKILPFVIVGLIVTIIAAMYFTKPEARKRPQFEQAVIVEVQTIEPKPFQVYIDSFGNIEAKTSGNLVAQASGIITSVSEKMESGRSFKKGDLLATIDDKDYRIEVTIARAELANAKLSLQQEEALAEQAIRDWQKINPNKKASSLVLRKPQIASAKAKLDAAQARLEKAELALERTNIIAPYDGKVISKLSDLGQLVNQNTAIASIFSTSNLEIRLPIPTSKVEFLPSFNQDSKVELVADFGTFSKSWPATLDRSDSIIDQTSRQWFVTAIIDGSILENEPLLKVGQFVNARIFGVSLDQAIVIPSKYIYDDGQVYLYRDGKLARQKIETQWQGGDLSLIKSGVAAGDQLITTPLRFVADGASLQIKGQAAAKKWQGKPGNAQTKKKKATNGDSK